MAKNQKGMAFGQPGARIFHDDSGGLSFLGPVTVDVAFRTSGLCGSEGTFQQPLPGIIQKFTTMSAEGLFIGGKPGAMKNITIHHNHVTQSIDLPAKTAVGCIHVYTPKVKEFIFYTHGVGYDKRNDY